MLAAAILIVTVLNINTGSVHIPAGRILRILFTGRGETSEVGIIWKIRMPRILLSAVLGGGLALSGFLLQTFFGNPIAGPFVLGISSGAKMCVALVMIALLGRFGEVSSWILILAAFAGAMLSTAFILVVSRSVRHMAGLLVAGIMCLSDGRGLRAEHGREHPSLPCGSDPAVRHPVCLRHRLCRTGILCRHRRTFSGQTGPGDLETYRRHPRGLSGRRCFLHDQRPDRPHGLRPDGTQYQHSDQRTRRPDRHLHADQEETCFLKKLRIKGC